MTSQYFESSYLQKFLNNSKEKLDIYSLGIVLEKIFQPNSIIVSEILNISQTLFETELEKLLNKMLDPNPINRIDF